MQGPEVLKIIDWLIMSNSRAIMLQSLCGNIYKRSSSAQIKERELAQGNCRAKSGRRWHRMLPV